jgi:hypothetical protein
MADTHKLTKQDVGYSAVKAALGSIPILGSAASELFGLIVSPPLDKRRQQWMNEVADKLKELETNKKLDFEALGQNEQFIDTVIHATNLAIKTSEEEKIAALKNAVINTALDEAPEKSKSMVFLNLIDRFTVWHIKILVLFNNPKLWFEKAGRQPPNFYVGSLSAVLIEAFPSMKGQTDFTKVIWDDLHASGFHRSGDLLTGMTGDGTLAQRTTELGREFLSFISEH